MRASEVGKVGHPKQQFWFLMIDLTIFTAIKAINNTSKTNQTFLYPMKNPKRGFYWFKMKFYMYLASTKIFPKFPQVGKGKGKFSHYKHKPKILAFFVSGKDSRGFEHTTFGAGDGCSATSAILPANKNCQNLWFIFIMGKLPIPFHALRE